MVAPVVAAAGISAASNLLGGLFGRSSASEQRRAQEQANAANLAWAESQQSRNEQLQREFAQNGIRWKAADAKAAGLHPLFAMGASTQGFAPIAIGAGQQAAAESDWLGPTIRNMGQDLSRAVAAQATQQEREAQQLQLELLRAQVHKEYALAAEIESRARNHSIAMSYPAMPSNLSPIAVRELGPLIPGQGNGLVTQGSGAFRVEPQKVPTHAPGDPARLPSATPGYIPVSQPDRSVILMPAQGDQRMDEISALDVIPWLRANLQYNYNFIPEYVFGRDRGRSFTDAIARGIEAVRDSWRPFSHRQQLRGR